MKERKKVQTNLVVWENFGVRLQLILPLTTHRHLWGLGSRELKKEDQETLTISYRKEQSCWIKINSILRLTCSSKVDRDRFRELDWPGSALCEFWPNGLLLELVSDCKQSKPDNNTELKHIENFWSKRLSNNSFVQRLKIENIPFSLRSCSLILDQMNRQKDCNRKDNNIV